MHRGAHSLIACLEHQSENQVAEETMEILAARSHLVLERQ